MTGFLKAVLNKKLNLPEKTQFINCQLLKNQDTIQAMHCRCVFS